MPDASIWLQFSIIAIIVLVVGALGVGARKFWLEFTAWQDKQDVKREAEREKQRDWQERLLVKQEDINEKRELRWQDIYQQMMREVTNELKCLRNDLGEHHQMTVQISHKLDTQATRPINTRKKVE